MQCIQPTYNDPPLCRRCGRYLLPVGESKPSQLPCEGPFSLSELMSEIASILDRDRHLPQHEQTQLSLYLIDVGSNRIRSKL